MYIWIVVLIVCIAGAVGGCVNALMTDNRFILPKLEEENGILQAGILGNVIISAVAGLIAWGSAEPAANIVLCTLTNCDSKSPGENDVLLTVGTLMMVVLVGIAGARWLTSEIDKKVMQKQKEEIKALKIK